MKRKTDGLIVVAAFALLLLFVALATCGRQARAVPYMPETAEDAFERVSRRGYCVWPREEYMPEEPEKSEDDADGLVYLGKFWVTGYDACASCCGKTDGITASGAKAVAGATCAAALPFGTNLYIAGIGVRQVQDRGVGAGCVDVFCDGHDACYAVTGWYDVWEVMQ